jgi:hypothetical protein
MFKRGWFRGLSKGTFQVRIDFLLYLSKKNEQRGCEVFSRPVSPNAGVWRYGQV